MPVIQDAVLNHFPFGRINISEAKAMKSSANWYKLKKKVYIRNTEIDAKWSVKERWATKLENTLLNLKFYHYYKMIIATIVKHKEDKAKTIH